ncbi:hypothetical protein [Campylobacter vulpis]|uniref:hypothetical protein n=1 Tax=Campylobacter vulpis TaxID=1655500 RepID=UPI001BD00CAE|nr:hypothetical protein [Campylobacter vulpis]MBS4275652.1 hypothetical protein [Campylobacter vulpis]MBS4306862.1 hypothetical protein [Campylobacter vulpis]MBS4329015.1 hypothetical protein [Campylobacter vulpis]MBS4422814.1 hypothetical protein [Campylobacter vulpis]QNF77879.1 hypothetical protein CVULP_0846 [Campylobacter vulpis]
MTKENFKKLFVEAGFKGKQELAELLGLNYSSVNAWGSVKPYPKYLKSWFENYIKAKKYDEALGSGVDLGSAGSAENVEALRLENVRLREELREYEELKSVLKRVLL